MNKTLDNIYEEMLAVFAEVSGYLPSTSCDLAARLYAAAAQIQGLYLQAQWLLDQSFPQTAKGICLDQHAQLRGISRGVATRAAGTLRFGLSSAVGGDLNVDAGTVCMTASGIRFMQKETSHHSLLCQQELSYSPDRKISIQADNLNLVLLQPANIFERVPDVTSQP